MEFGLNDRIREVMEDNEFSPSAFAEELGVSRPLISHILSHRNKAGVELLQKVLHRFKGLNAQWLLAGTGSKYLNSIQQPDTSKRVTSDSLSSQKVDSENAVENSGGSGKYVKRIILFFNDGTFEVFEA